MVTKRIAAGGYRHLKIRRQLTGPTVQGGDGHVKDEAVWSEAMCPDRMTTGFAVPEPAITAGQNGS